MIQKPSMNIIKFQERRFNMGFIPHWCEYEESEWTSDCCSHPPLYNIEIEDGLDPIGICSSCREHTSFSNGEE